MNTLRPARFVLAALPLLGALFACSSDPADAKPATPVVPAPADGGATAAPADAGDDAAPTPTTGDAALTQALTTRLAGDRTGVCVAAAMIEKTVRRTVVCAGAPRDLGGRTAFEIGSVTKTMTATLIADLARAGKLALQDPLAEHLPPGTTVPSFGGEPIRLAHLLSHTAGLPPIPPSVTEVDPADPYAKIGEAEVLSGLAGVTLTEKPGTTWAYSNYGYMLLSLVVTRVSGQDLATALRTRLFEPAGITDAFLGAPPAGVRLAGGHTQDGASAGAWTFPTNLAGEGGVRATLDAVIRYAEAGLGRVPGPDGTLPALLASTHASLHLPTPGGDGQPDMALGWVRLPVEGGALIAHDGETGSASSMVVLDPARDRAVVLLADTAVTDSGLLAELSSSLLDPTIPMPGPRLPKTPDPAELAKLAGHYALGEAAVELRVRDGGLDAIVDGVELTLGHDSRGDFWPRGRDGLLTPVTGPDGKPTFVWTGDGQPLLAVRQP